MATDILRRHIPAMMEYETYKAQDAVIARYGALFHPNNLDNLTAEEFHSFLLYQNNQHWKGISRHVTSIVRDMDRLRQALHILLDESYPIEDRLNTLFPKHEPNYIKGLGRAVATPILMVVYPERYGVLNTISEEGLKVIGEYPDLPRGTTFGEEYKAVNSVLNRLADELGLSLWELDSLWWRVTGEEPLATDGDEEDIEIVDELVAFSLERHLSDFLYENWDSTDFGQEYELYEEGGNLAQEYQTSVGRIDLLARHRTTGDWLVIELKRRRSSDAVVGQVMRYMSWVRHNLASDNEEVRAIIVVHSVDDNLRYSLMSARAEVQLYTYGVQFFVNEVDVERW